MYSKFQLAVKYLKYYFSSSNGKGHGTHSPFIFHFITNILNNKKQYKEYASVEELRSSLLANKTILEIEDFGAGSAVNKTNKRTVSAIAKNSVKPKKFGQLLFRMVRAYKPAQILELGTSLGVTTAYLALADPESNLVTLEGAKSVADMARSNLATLGIKNASIQEGNFDDTLPGILNNVSVLDLVFIDGNHRREPTERYFQQLLTRVNNDTIIIFDDIHWSMEMEAAWHFIKNHPEVRCTIDLFFIGIVLFRKEFIAKQHFAIRF